MVTKKQITKDKNIPRKSRRR